MKRPQDYLKFFLNREIIWKLTVQHKFRSWFHKDKGHFRGLVTFDWTKVHVVGLKQGGMMATVMLTFLS